MKKIFLMMLLSVAMTVSVSAVNAQAQTPFPDQLELEYILKAFGMSLGTMKKRVQLDDGAYTADSSINPGGAAKIFFSGKISESSQFRIENSIMLPIEFHAIRKGSKPYDRKATFDHAEKLVRYSDGSTEPLRENTFDLGSFPFAFMLEDLNQINNKVFEINSGKDYDTYQITNSENQQIDTPAGTFDTTKITLKRVDKDNRFFYVWLDKENHYPVRIIREKEGKQSILELKSIKN